MSKKFWTLKPTHYFTKQLPSGGRNQVVWAAFGCALYFWARTHNWNTTSNDTVGKTQQNTHGRAWF